MWLAATREQFACDWRLQDKRQADKRCVKGRLYIIIKFFSIGKSTSSTMPLIIQLTAPGYLVWKCASAIDDKATRIQILHALAASCMQSRQFFASTQREQLYE